MAPPQIVTAKETLPENRGVEMSSEFVLNIFPLVNLGELVLSSVLDLAIVSDYWGPCSQNALYSFYKPCYRLVLGYKSKLTRLVIDLKLTLT